MIACVYAIYYMALHVQKAICGDWLISFLSGLILWKVSTGSKVPPTWGLLSINQDIHPSIHLSLFVNLSSTAIILQSCRHKLIDVLSRATLYHIHAFMAIFSQLSQARNHFKDLLLTEVWPAVAFGWKPTKYRWKLFFALLPFFR